MYKVVVNLIRHDGSSDLDQIVVSSVKSFPKENVGRFAFARLIESLFGDDFQKGYDELVLPRKLKPVQPTYVATDQEDIDE